MLTTPQTYPNLHRRPGGLFGHYYQWESNFHRFHAPTRDREVCSICRDLLFRSFRTKRSPLILFLGKAPGRCVTLNRPHFTYLRLVSVSTGGSYAESNAHSYFVLKGTIIEVTPRGVTTS